MEKEEIREPLEGGTTNQTTEKISRGDVSVVRKESEHLNKELIKEIQFTLDLDDEDKKHFPEVLEYSLEPPVFYEMPFYEIKTIRNSILDEEINAEKSIVIIKNILKYMFEKIFSKNVEDSNLNLLDKTIFSRIKKRQSQLAEEFEIIRDFVKAKKIIIEGKEYMNILEMIEKISSSEEILKRITPKKTHMIHGDFHFDNILIDPKNPDNFILIDTRGEKEGYDYAYDLGKLWHSFHGMYDMIHKENFELEYELQDETMVVKKFKLNNNIFIDVCNEIYGRKEEFLKICKEYTNEEDTELQILFSEAAHFCALAPFQLLNNGIEKYPIGRYLTGVKLMNEMINKLDEGSD